MVIVNPFRIFVFLFLLPVLACTSRPQLPQVPLVPKAKPKPAPTAPSTINVKVNPGGPAVFTTSTAEFDLRPDGYVQAFLFKDVRKLSLDDPRVGAPAESDYAVIDGKDIHFILDFQQAQELETIGAMGVGKRLQVPARPLGPSGMYLHRTLVLEAYDKFPNVLFSTVVYENTGATTLHFEKTIDQRHRISAKMAGPGQAWEVWSYHRVSSEGKGEVVRVTQTFSRRNALGSSNEKQPKDLPVVAVWTGDVGEAIGEVDAVPVDSALPVKADADGRVDLQLESAAKTMLKPTDTYSTPRSFFCIYAGDGAEPEHLLSALPSRPSAPPAKPPSKPSNSTSTQP